MVDGQEKPQLDFKETGKNEVFLATQSKIEDRFLWVTKFPKENRYPIIFGAVFETLSVAEIEKERVETVQQNIAREIIEELFQKAEYVLDFNMPFKPDFVSVVFDKNGHLIVDEVVEIKSSFLALKHGVDKNQPQKSLSTIKNIVRLVDDLISSDSVSVIDTIHLPRNNKKIGRDLLRESFRKIKSAGFTDTISLSPELKYHIIMPADEIEIAPEIKLTYESKPIDVTITRSKFSKRDIHSIIDHYQETP
ncbi:hypothetical protein D4S03_02725 [bacterium]|nr:MAG: hypothetical protein D4S03_02725 [bacterium]